MRGGQPSRRRAARARLGRLGEWLARAFFVLRGYRVVATNWRDHCGEIDLVVARGDHVRIVEVRTVRAGRGTTATALVPDAKRRQVLRVAAHLRARLDLRDCIVSHDVVTVRFRWGVVPHLRWYPNALQS